MTFVKGKFTLIATNLFYYQTFYNKLIFNFSCRIKEVSLIAANRKAEAPTKV